MAGWIMPQKKKKDIETFPIGEELIGFESLTPSQQTASQALLAALTGRLQGGAAPFKFPSFAYEGVSPADVGTLPTALSTGGALAERTLASLMSGAGARPTQTLEEIIAGIPTFGGELGEETRGALARALSGEFPEEYFQASIAGPARRAFARETAPAIKEEFAGPGTFWGTARAGAVTGERGKMEENLASIRGELGNEAQSRSLQAVATSITARQNQISMAIQELTNQRNYATAEQATRLNAAIAQLQAARNAQTAEANELNRLSQGKYQEIAMAQERYVTELKVAYDEYTRSNPAMAETLQAILQYLGIPMLAAYQPYEEGSSGGNALASQLSQS